eukprot:4361495-Pleurochrysis_carterae.AAC.1
MANSGAGVSFIQWPPASLRVAFLFTETAVPERGLQLNEIKFYDERQEIIPILEASNPGGFSLPGEGPVEVLDGLRVGSGSKWLDLNKLCHVPGAEGVRKWTASLIDALKAGISTLRKGLDVCRARAGNERRISTRTDS